MSSDAQPLSRERILKAALAYIDGEGMAALTMDRLGATLGVSGMALYKHFPGKQALLTALVESLLTTLELPTAEAEWHESLSAFYRSLWRLYRSHPNCLALLTAQPLSSPAIRACTAANLGVLTEAAVEGPVARQALLALLGYTLGLATLASGGYLAAGEKATDGAAISDADFEQGLAIVLRGLDAQLH